MPLSYDKFHTHALIWVINKRKCVSFFNKMLFIHVFKPHRVYTGEDFVNLLNGTPRRGVISNRYRYRSINELKCPILN